MRSIRQLVATSVVAVSAFAAMPAVSEAAACTGADTAGSSSDQDFTSLGPDTLTF